MNIFKIGYEEAKRLLNLLYNNPYTLVAEHVEVLHSITDENGVTLKEAVDNERTSLAQQASVESVTQENTTTPKAG